MFRLATQFWPIGAALNSIVAILGRVKLTAQPCGEGGKPGRSLAKNVQESSLIINRPNVQSWRRSHSSGRNQSKGCGIASASADGGQQGAGGMYRVTQQVVYMHPIRADAIVTLPQNRVWVCKQIDGPP